MLALAAALVWLGLYPHPVLALAGPALESLRGAAGTVIAMAAGS